ncbi:Transposase and inactivated derivative [Sagittula stellata E-37]|uniref:Transposase and inactivated derivative n=1 Tax=Sagittula stellata (strain ATCC 700073 / DSM 11524 / E-37) TaxID=388399 RepID=A3JZD2_SAGS3|nr:Transposase and inactivated derivative [Sagittula stellata E-37]
MRRRRGAKRLVARVATSLPDGRRFRVLVVVDDYGRERLALVADTSLSGLRAVRELDGLIMQRGRPAMVVSGNGTELTWLAVLSWCQSTGIECGLVAHISDEDSL